MNKQNWLVVSDIHGALSGAEAMAEAYAYHQASMVLCLGDILYHGPRNDLPSDYAPKKVIPIMNRFKEKIIAVRGNCEAEVDQMVLDFPCMSDYCAMPFNDHKLFMSHGHIYGPDHLPVLEEGDLFLSGHTHIPATGQKDGIWLLNPGSISLPKQNHPRSYGILNKDGFTVYTLNHQPYMQAEF